VIRPLPFAPLLLCVLLAPPVAAQSSLGGQGAAPPRPAAPRPAPQQPARSQPAKPPQGGTAAPARPPGATAARPPAAPAPPRAAAAPAAPARPNAAPSTRAGAGQAPNTAPAAGSPRRRRAAAAGAAAAGAAAGAATAAVVRPPEPEPPPPAPPKPVVGTVTGLPLPRFAALGSNQVNLRIGPDLRYRIEWTYQRRDLPVQIIEEHQIWRKIRDPEGTEGWVQRPLLNARRTFLVQGDGERTLRRRPEGESAPVAHLKPGVIGAVRRCEAGSAWCEVRVADHSGFLRRSEMWGVAADEAIE
jgi:SH3-like domain-containing protein